MVVQVGCPYKLFSLATVEPEQPGSAAKPDTIQNGDVVQLLRTPAWEAGALRILIVGILHMQRSRWPAHLGSNCLVEIRVHFVSRNDEREYNGF